MRKIFRGKTDSQPDHPVVTEPRPNFRITSDGKVRPKPARPAPPPYDWQHDPDYANREANQPEPTGLTGIDIPLDEQSSEFSTLDRVMLNTGDMVSRGLGIIGMSELVQNKYNAGVLAIGALAAVTAGVVLQQIG